ncbi:MAG: hypothetical protein NPIRA03_30880 [Nitrospirales bacterium]|nr:MAG: hypothetical protein NPIRA03_30880 [Nitrospirales bacterium]
MTKSQKLTHEQIRIETMTPNSQTKFCNALTETQLISIEKGRVWLSEDTSPFSRKLYDRLLEEHPVLRKPLLTTGFQEFQMAFLKGFAAIVSAYRTGRDFRAELEKYWISPIVVFTPPMEGRRFDRLAETFLRTVAECVEDAWSPAVEEAWRVAIREMKRELVADGD